MDRTVYVDVEEMEPGFLGVIMPSVEKKPKEILFAGKTIQSTAVSEKKDPAYQILSTEYGVDFIFEGKYPKLLFYPVPQLFVFATDRKEGVFASTKQAPAFDEVDTPIYYIDNEKRMYQIAENLKSFLQLIVFQFDWKKTLTGESFNPPKNRDIDYLIQLLDLIPKEANKIFEWKQSSNVRLFASIEEAKEKNVFIDTASFNGPSL